MASLDSKEIKGKPNDLDYIEVRWFQKTGQTAGFSNYRSERSADAHLFVYCRRFQITTRHALR